MSGYSLQNIVGGADTPILNGCSDHMSPLSLSPIVNLGPPSSNVREFPQPYFNNDSKESAPSTASVLSSEKGGTTYGRGGEGRRGGEEGIGGGEEGRRMGTEGWERNGAGHGEVRGDGENGVGSCKGGSEVFSGVSHGGVLLKHMPYLPSSSNPIRVSPEWLEEGGGGECEGGGGRNTGPMVTRSSLGGKSVVDEEVKELEQKVKVSS